MNGLRFGQKFRDSTSLVVLHGLFGSSRNWRNISESLSKSCDMQVFALDLRNHNLARNALRGPIQSWQTLVDDLNRFVSTELPNRKLHLLGHSFGGQVCMASVLSNQASLLRDQTESLIVVDVSLRHPANSSNLSSKNDHLYRIMTVMDSISKSRPTLKSDVVEKLTSVEPDRNVVDFLLTNLIRTSDGVYGFSNLGLEDLIQAWPRLKTDWALQRTARFKPWTGRSFFVKGEHSNYIDASMGDYKDISDFFPNAQIDTVSKSGHWPHFDNPVEFLGLIERILRQ